MGNIVDFQNIQYLDLETVKQWTHVDQDFEDDDLLLFGLIDVAQAAVEKYLDMPLEDIAQNGVLPSPIKQAMLFLIATYYDQRDSVSSGTMSPVPETFELLCDLYRNYASDLAIKRNTSN